VGLTAIALILAILFGGVAAASWVGGELSSRSWPDRQPDDAGSVR
jgi:hypothetical protein